MKSLIFATALLLSTSAFAGDCFDANFVHSWDYDNHTEVLKVQSFRDVYEVKLSFSCFELPWAHAIGFKAFSGSYVCSGDEVVVYDAWNKPVEICRINSIKKTK